MKRRNYSIKKELLLKIYHFDSCQRQSSTRIFLQKFTNLKANFVGEIFLNSLEVGYKDF